MYLSKFFENYIKGTPQKAIVANRKVLLCRLTEAVIEGIEIKNSAKNVYITSRCVKHLFDKRPAEEFLFIIDHLHEIVKCPDRIYGNAEGKRGDFCLTKRISNEEYLCAVEILEISSVVRECNELAGSNKASADLTVREIQVSTAFRIRDEKYIIKNYTLLWDWGNGNPHRSALDTPEESTNAPQ
ncbi:MAG: hypothetical protein WCK16_01775 [Candidatus Moraniibacteriota bacterium]